MATVATPVTQMMHTTQPLASAEADVWSGGDAVARNTARPASTIASATHSERLMGWWDHAALRVRVKSRDVVRRG